MSAWKNYLQRPTVLAHWLLVRAERRRRNQRLAQTGWRKSRHEMRPAERCEEIHFILDSHHVMWNKSVYTAYIASRRPKSESVTYRPTDQRTDTRSCTTFAKFESQSLVDLLTRKSKYHQSNIMYVLCSVCPSWASTTACILLGMLS